jgi:hypothetical protein
MEMIMKTPIIACTLLSTLIACGDKTEDTSSNTTTDTTQEEAFAPTLGEWTMTNLEITADTCGLTQGDTGTPEDSVLTLTQNTDGTYGLTVDADLSFSCTLTGKNLACDPYTQSDNGISQSMTVTATFVDANNLHGSLGMDLTCAEGADCSMYQQMGMTIPCSMVGSFDGSVVQ